MFIIAKHSKPHTYENTVEVVLVDTKPTSEEIRQKFRTEFEDYDISISEVAEEPNLKDAVFHVLDNVGWVDKKEAIKDGSTTTLYAAFGGDRFVSFIISDSESEAAKKVAAPDDDDPVIRAVNVPNKLMEALKKGKAFLINTDLLEENEEKPKEAVSVDDEECWWISDIEPINENWRIEDIKLNKVITDV